MSRAPTGAATPKILAQRPAKHKFRFPERME
jgi:hypothetical protein